MDVSEDLGPGAPAGRSDAGDRLGADDRAGPEVVRVVVVDDQAPFRAAARAVLARTPGFALVGEASDGEAALALVDEVRPQLVLMDIMMPVLDGLAATARLRGLHPGVVVVLVSTYEQGSLPEGVAAAGAAAYLHKEELSPRVLADLWHAHAPRPT